MQSSFKIGTVMGIPIKIHISFLIVLPLFAFIFYSIPEPYGFQNLEPAYMGYLFSLLTTILLFACVILHELGHSYLARRYGVKIDNITLFLIGGVSSMEEIPRNPSQEARMAFAGPLVSFITGFGLLMLNFLAVQVIAGYEATAVYNMFQLLASINIVLGLFNLLPAFPMDGGRILRALFAKRMSYVRATHAAANVGKIFAFLMALTGLLSSPWNPWLLLIAVFVYMGASGEDSSTTITSTLGKVSVRDVMSTEVITVPPDLNIEELVHFMFEHKHMGYPVVERNVLKGIITFTDVRHVPPVDRVAILVSEVMTKNVITIPPDASANEAFKMLTVNNIGRLVVMENDDAIAGILSRTDLMHTMALLSQ
jgi:Zn-dependent protease/CBS domain-containing protein